MTPASAFVRRLPRALLRWSPRRHARHLPPAPPAGDTAGRAGGRRSRRLRQEAGVADLRRDRARGDTGKPFAGNSLACQNCHLDAGSNHAGIPLVGVAKAYPKFSARSGRVISLTGAHQRMHDALDERQAAARRLARDGGVPRLYRARIDGPPAVQAAPAAEPPAPADAGRGAGVYGRTCAVCHQPHGLGLRAGMGYQFPPLWGPDSFNDGAGMDRFDRAVVFIQQNMPRGVDPAPSAAQPAGGLGRRRLPESPA